MTYPNLGLSEESIGGYNANQEGEEGSVVGTSG